MTSEIFTEVDEMCNYGQGIAERNYKRGVDDGREQGIEQGVEQSRSDITSLYHYLDEQNRFEDFDRAMHDPDYLDTLLDQFRSVKRDR